VTAVWLNRSGRPLRFVLDGAWNFLFGLALFTALLYLLRPALGYLGVLTIATVIAVIQSHATQRILVWRSHAPYLPELTRFAALYVGTFLANLALLAVAVDGLGFPVLPSQWVIGVGLLVPTYFFQRAWAFRGRSHA
jgi:putative flippase GtrA